MKHILFYPLLFFICSCQSQDNGLKNRDVIYYFKEAKTLENKERIKQKFAVDSVTVSEEYLDPVTKKLNAKGFNKLQEIKEKVLTPYYADYLFLKKISHGNKIYALYFTMPSLYDIEYVVFRFDDGKWNNVERINRALSSKNSQILKLSWNYDDAPLKMDHKSNIFIENDYLVFKLGDICLSLYDLRSEKLLIKEERPFNLPNLYTRENKEAWVRENTHKEIEGLLRLNRN